MRIALIVTLAVVIMAGAVACSGANSDDADEERETSPDINATISAAVAKAVAEEAGRTESVVATRGILTPVSASGQTNWLDGLSQFRRIKVARDQVQCVGYENGRYAANIHSIIRVDDGYYALGNPGQAVAFWDDNSGCRIGVITDESLE